MTTPPPERRSPAQRLVPVFYAGLAVLLAALFLPSVLRPPQDQQSTTAAFSADAPPDDTPPEAIIQSVREASSQTAGRAEPEVIVEEVVIQEEAPPPKQAVRAGCFGDPPRQTESLYSHLCVPAWTGTDNGGETYRGVTGEEIRLGIAVPLDSTPTEGPLPRDFSVSDTDEVRLLKVWQTYFNERFEFYGRYLQFYVFKVSSSNETSAREVAAETSTRHGGMFALAHLTATTTAAVTNELARQQVLNFTHDANPADFYRDNHPFVYSFDMDSWQTRNLATELICKQWAGKPPGELNGREDISFDYEAPRRFGLLVYQDELRQGATDMYRDGLARCGEEFVASQEYNIGSSGADGIAQALAKMRASGVTTIVISADGLTPGALTNEAQRIAYYPEWICVTNCDSNSAGRLLEDNQAEHFVTIGIEEIPRAEVDKDWYRAYKEIDPEGAPEDDYFRELQQLAGGIQHAGPNLNPETFWEGLRNQPCREPDPVWSIGGCYSGPDPSKEVLFLGDYTYSDYAALAWFDNAGPDPEDTRDGAWCWMNFGARYKLGTMPTEPLPFRDPEQCIYSPERGQQG